MSTTYTHTKDTRAMKIGYARVSSKDQNEAKQMQAMYEAGIPAEQIYTDKASGKDFNRPQYQQMQKVLRSGDTLVVQSLDRLGRNYTEIKAEFSKLTSKGIYINVLDMPLLNTDQVVAGNLTMQFISDLVLSVLSYVAEQERTNIRQRQADGIRAAKANKVRFGRPAALGKVKDAQALIAGGKSIVQACAAVGITRQTYYNALKK